MSRYLDAITDDRAVRLGVGGGALTSVSGLVAYVLVPIVRGGRVVADAALVSLDALASSPVAVHAAVFVVPAAVTCLVGALEHSTGIRDRVTPTKLLAGNVLLPVVTILGWYLLGGLLLAGGFSSTAQPGERSLSFVLVVPFVLFWGVIVVVPLLALVVAAVVTAGATGYLVGVAAEAIRN